ncbi:unnamed protein product [Rotaria sordida]|uniref:ABC transporter domain-containing protein n=1 Tax=Rotaria sordida TaxID=392033 RepID=A0A814GN95_9BILA|nr:unnamed protein product [Rotaria sordida]CAF0998656.1 unnamed protein product [Rotaria sordida]
MTTLIVANDEKEDIIFPLLKTTTPVYNDSIILESTLIDSNNYQQNDLIDNNKEKEKSIEISFNTNEFELITISFYNINYIIGNNRIINKLSTRFQTKTFQFWKPIPSKQILTNVSGIFTPGMNAILGPTGCGKSTLLDILADRKDSHGLSGNVLVSGQPRPSYFKYIIGYVIQDDILSGTLTVRENLLFSANIRLPRSIKMNKRIERVNQIIRDLDLESCADTLIGTDFVRGISGGEKKRTSIGMELVLSPNLLFLDEPTTGLDACTAQNVMSCLHKLSRQGRTIIFSIHQPRYSIFKLFDRVLFLFAGHNIYLGPSIDVLSYFASHGYNCEEHNNPADFVLDLLIESNNTCSTKLQTAYLHSNMHLNICQIIRNDMNKNENKDNSLLKYNTFRTYSHEFYYVAQRTLCNVLRNPSLFASQIISVIIYGLFTGLIFNKLETTVEIGAYNRFGAIFFIISCQVLGAVNALEPLIKERALFIHENVSGYYRISSFYLAKLIIDLPLVHIIPSIIYIIITFFLTGLRQSIENFIIFFITNLMAKIFGSSMCYFIAASTSTFGIALVMVICCYVTMMLFSGFLINIASIVNFLRWIQWISVFRYASNVLAINEFRNLTLCSPFDIDVCSMKGEDILSHRHISYATNWDIWKNILALLLISLIFFIMAYIQLLRIKKFK